MTCKCFLIPEHISKIVITHETFHYYFLLLTLAEGALDKILKKNIEMVFCSYYNETLST